MHRLKWLIGVICWVYLVALAISWSALRVTGDRWWVATLVLFGPRWLCALPLPVLILAALIFRRRSLVVLLFAVAIAGFGVMDLRLAWRTTFGGGDSGNQFRLRVLTCNIHRGQLRPGLLGELIAKERPDVVALQEWSTSYEWQVFGAGGWYILRDDELCIASRYPVRRGQNLAKGHWNGPGAAVCYELDTPAGPVPFINVHLASPHHAFEDAIDRSDGADAKIQENSGSRLAQMQDLKRSADALGGNVLMAGDFNTPSDSSLYRDTLFSLTDAFSQAGTGFGWTYYMRFTAVRIDHILAGTAWQCRQCRVGPAVGSPHRPVIADFTAAARGS